MAHPYRIWHPFTQMARFDAEPKLVVERAEGNRLIDVDGREYIDAVASLWSVIHGHGHPRIVEAIQAQAAKLQHSTLLGISHPAAITFADHLIRHLPQGLSRVSRCSSSRCGSRTGTVTAAGGAHQTPSATPHASTRCATSSRPGRESAGCRFRS